mmetsp:Transcript_1355/g.2755  ORF Transcript_1355/g.2755 Transcript_1355/m.2755 type:complete len:129 (-) Transcript_1355:2181-2567(-)
MMFYSQSEKIKTGIATSFLFSPIFFTDNDTDISQRYIYTTNPWNVNSTSCHILDILLPIHSEKGPFFVWYTMGEEFVCNKSIKDGGKRVTEYELGADTPIEPASVGRVAEVFVAMFHVEERRDTDIKK